MGLYALPAGGRLRVSPSAIAAERQDAIDELAFGGASHADFNDRTVQVVSSVLAGDDAALQAELAGDPQRLERYRRLIGELRGDVSAARTLPSHLPGVPATHVAARERSIAFYWQEGRLLGLGEGDPDARFEVPVARADVGYVAYHLRGERVMRVDFEEGGLVLSSNGRQVRAERL